MSSSLAYTRSGSGAPLVLLHGIGLNRQSWNPVVPALARQFDVIAVDLPGFGDSAPATPAEAGPRALAEAVACQPLTQDDRNLRGLGVQVSCFDLSCDTAEPAR